ncbi:hypothetical protein G7046_g5171 [Stylonectria norvegica]|nr:hypothetical protein G7046_g5171 [Stylonectria norvegica]
MLQTVGHALWKRAVEEGQDAEYELPAWAGLVYLLDLIILLPIFLVISYTFKQVYPVLAIIEDENPPAYEPVSLNDDGASLAEESPIAVSGSKPTNGAAGTVTSSFRAIHRVLLANGGVRAYFRGFTCLFAQNILTGLLMGIFTGVFGGLFTPVATLIAGLTLVQYSTAWVHIVITRPSPLHFWSRLPPFKRTFEATWKAVGAYWLATELAKWIPFVFAKILHFSIPRFTPGQPTEIPQSNGQVWKGLVLLAIGFTCQVFITIPAHVILVRVQASLLPDEEDTIVPFDRSFEGLVEPAVVGGLGYVTLKSAWATFSRAAWRRLVILYVKIFAVTAAFVVFALVIIVPEFLLMASKAQPKNGGEPVL